MQNPFGSAVFTVSAASSAQMPADRGAEVAVVGRSNVGKSSFINALTGRRKLARTSKTPGRTQLINFFSLDDRRRLVDLPGYGFAKVPPGVKHQWRALIEAYLSSRRSLRGVVVLMDARHPLTPLDWQMLRWCHAHRREVLVILTKADKLGRGQANKALKAVCGALDAGLPRPAEGSPAAVALFSALRPGEGGTVRSRLYEWLSLR